MVMKTSVEFGEQLIGFIQNAIATNDDPIEADTDLLLTGLVDSLGVILIVDWLEEQLDVEIDPADVTLENFRQVSDMLTYLGRRDAIAKPDA
jgi:acyl carrier protein